MAPLTSRSKPFQLTEVGSITDCTSRDPMTSNLHNQLRGRLKEEFKPDLHSQLSVTWQ